MTTNTTEIARKDQLSIWQKFLSKEDWWAVWLGSSISWIAVAPAKWSTLSQLATQFSTNAIRWLALLYNLEPPLVALVLGLIISNVIGLPRWLDAGFRVEFYIKLGIVLLGAGLPFTLIIWAGPAAILQASIASIVTFLVVFFTARKLGLDQRLAAVLGAASANRHKPGGFLGNNSHFRVAVGFTHDAPANGSRGRMDRDIGICRRRRPGRCPILWGIGG
jgi:hypothetical protein